MTRRRGEKTIESVITIDGRRFLKLCCRHRRRRRRRRRTCSCCCGRNMEQKSERKGK
jgi:hypothetical protein